MNFAQAKLIYVLLCAGLALIILSPTLFGVVSFPEDEKFSELYVLDSNHMLESIPTNVLADFPYTIYLGVGNHMGNVESYLVYVKLRNQTEASPDSKNGLPSPLPPIFEYRAILGDGETWEKELTFSLEDVFSYGDEIEVSALTMNSCSMEVAKVSVFDDVRKGFFYQLFFELWIYNSATLSFDFHNRSVGLSIMVTPSK